jgi:hypothetical protein
VRFSRRGPERLSGCRVDSTAPFSGTGLDSLATARGALMSIQGSPLAEATSNTTYRKIIIVPPAGAELFTAPCCIPSGLTASSRHASPSEPPSMPIEMRKRKLAQLVRHVGSGLHLSEHLHGHGIEIFEHACKLLVAKASSASGWARATSPAAPTTGSRSRTRPRQRSGARRRRTGARYDGDDDGRQESAQISEQGT